MNISFTQFSFSAFLEMDLLPPGEMFFDPGVAFTVPAQSTVQFNIEDDDEFLSGDVPGLSTNELSVDETGQTGSFTLDGLAFDLTGQIFIERILVLNDADGNEYILAEIEIENGDAPGAGDDFFTFVGAIPDAGTELTVVLGLDIFGDGISFSEFGATPFGSEPEDVSQVIDFDNSSSGALDQNDFAGVTITAQRRVDGNDRIVIEAEDLQTDDFVAVRGRRASDRELVRLNQSEGELSTTFAGDTGTYDISLRLQDERDGESEIDIIIDGVVVDTIILDNNNNGRGSNNGRFSTFTLEDITIAEGAEIVFAARRDGGEFVRFDQVTFTQQSGLEDASALIFDSNNPTGGDTDLTSGDDNILIISEDDDASDPDDNRDGGVITFDFNNTSNVESIDIIDVEEEGGELRLFDDAGNLIATIAIPAGEDNTVQTLDINVDGVARLEVDLVGSGAVDNLAFTTPAETAGAVVNSASSDAFAFVGDTDAIDIDLVSDFGDPFAGQAVHAGSNELTVDGFAASDVFTMFDEVEAPAASSMTDYFLA